jgi:hypothetical protein
MDEPHWHHPLEHILTFQWGKVEMNLPGSEEYDPAFPWIAKIRKDGRVAANLDQ